MITLHVALTVQNRSDIETVAALLAEHAQLSRAEPGCHRFELLRSHEEPSRFFIIEDWASSAALDAHREATAFTTIYLPRVLPLVERCADEVTPVGQA